MTLSSCGPLLYDPVKLHLPMLNSQGEAQIEGSVGVLGYSGAIAYAFGDHLAVQADTHYFTPDSQGIYQRFFEFGFGYFGMFGRRRPWEAYLTFANSKSNASGSENPLGGPLNLITIESNYWQIALQGQLMTNEVDTAERKHTDNIFWDHAFAARLSYVHFMTYKEARYDDTAHTVIYNNVHPREMYLEFASISQFGANGFSFEMEVGIVNRVLQFVGKYKDKPSKDLSYWCPIILSFGFNWHFR